MQPNMLAYYQQVLEKISQADPRTFRKEMRKAFKRLSPDQREELKTWFRSACVCRLPANQLVPARVAGNGHGGQLK